VFTSKELLKKSGVTALVLSTITNLLQSMQLGKRNSRILTLFSEREERES